MALKPNPLDAWPCFAAEVRKRLGAGAAAYGDRSFARPLAELVDEIRQELHDVCGWAYILDQRLASITARLQHALPAPEGCTSPADQPERFTTIRQLDGTTLELLARLAEHLRLPPGAVITLALQALQERCDPQPTKSCNHLLEGK